MENHSDTKNLASGTERQFLHDLSNPLSIAYGGLKLVAAKIENAPATSITMDEVYKKLEKAILYFEKANRLIDDRRKFIHSTLSEDLE